MSSITKILCNNFAGIKRVCSDFSSSQITASDIQNVELFNTGVNSGVGIRSMKGNTALLTLGSDDEKIINIFQSIQNDTTYFIVHTETSLEGRLYEFSPVSTTLTLKKSGLALTGKSCAITFAQGWNDLFIFSTGKEFYSLQFGKYNESGELNEITKFTPKDVDNREVNGLGLSIFDGRLWVFNGNTLWYSVKENCFDFSTEDASITTSAGYIEYTKKITAIYPYLGKLAVFHNDSSSLIAINSDYSYFQTDESPGGCAGMNSLIFHGTELYFYDDTKKGIFSFSQVVNGDKTLGSNIGLDIQEELLTIDSKKLDYIKTLSVVQSERNEIWFLIPTRDEYYSTILIFDYINKQWLKRKSQKLVDIKIIDNIFYSATEKEILYEYDGDSFNGEFIESYYNCSPLNLSSDNTIKTFYMPPKITYDTDYFNDFYVKYTKNYDKLKLPRIKRIISKTLKNLFYWDKSYWDTQSKFRPKDIVSTEKLPISTFKALEIAFFTSEKSQGFAIKNIEFQKIKVKSA